MTPNREDWRCIQTEKRSRRFSSFSAESLPLNPRKRGPFTRSGIASIPNFKRHARGRTVQKAEPHNNVIRQTTPERAQSCKVAQ